MIFGGIDGVDATWEHGEGSATGVEGGAVGCGIDATGEATDDGESGAGKLCGKAFGLAEAVD